MSGIYIPGAKIPDGDYVRVLMLHKDGTCVDGIGNVFKVIPVPPHGRLGDLDELHKEAVRRAEKTGAYDSWYNCADRVISAFDIENAPTIIPASEEK